MTKIENQIQYEWAVKRVEYLLPLVDDDTPSDNPNSIELELLSNLAADYSEEHFSIGEPAPVDVQPSFLTQYPQSFINNFNILRANFGYMENIIRDLIIFFSYKQQSNLFGYIEFDIKEFCDVMAYKPCSMQRRCKQLTELKGKNALLTTYNGHNWDSHIEYALLCMIKTNLFLSSSDGANTGNGTYQLISQIEIDNGYRRRSFRLKLGHFTTQSLLKRYVNIELDDYVMLQKLQTRIKGNSGLTNLYLFLMQLFSIFQTEKGSSSIILTVDDISTIINYPITENNHRKRKFTIKSYFEKLKKNLQNVFFNYSFEKFNGVSRFEYRVVITFNDVKGLAYDNLFHKFKVTVFDKYENIYKKQNSLINFTDKKQPNEFVNWFYDQSLNKEEKQLAQVESIVIIFTTLIKTNMTADQIATIVDSYYYETNLSALYQYFKEFEDKLVEDRQNISETEFEQLIIRNDRDRISKLIDEGCRYHLSNYVHIQTAFMHGNYALVKYLTKQGALVDKPFLDSIQATKTKQAKELYNELMKMKSICITQYHDTYMDLKENIQIVATMEELPNDLGVPIVSLIDTKANSDIEEVIAEIKKLKTEIDTKFSVLREMILK